MSTRGASLDDRRLQGDEEEEEKDVEEEEEEEVGEAPAAAAVRVAVAVTVDDLVDAAPGKPLDGPQPIFGFSEDTPLTGRAASRGRWLVVTIASSLQVGNVRPADTPPPPDAGHAEDEAGVVALLLVRGRGSAASLLPLRCEETRACAGRGKLGKNNITRDVRLPVDG